MNLIKKYLWIISNNNIDAAKKLELTSVKKYWKYTKQVRKKVNWLYDLILVLAIFVKYLSKIYDNKKVIENMKMKQNIDPQ